MQFEARYYRGLKEGHPEKTYEYLMEMMATTIATEREEIDLTKPRESVSYWELKH